MTFILRSNKKDSVKTYVSENGFYKIIKRSNTGYVLKRVSLFDTIGEMIGEFDTLEEATNFLNI